MKTSMILLAKWHLLDASVRMKDNSDIFGKIMNCINNPEDNYINIENIISLDVEHKITTSLYLALACIENITNSN